MVAKRISIGTGLKFLRGHKTDVNRYLANFYHNYEDRAIIKSFFYENSKQARVIVRDYTTSPDLKISYVLNELSYGKSKIVIVVGARGSGKTGLTMFVIDELHKEQEHNKFYFVGEDINPEIFPDFIKVVPEIEKVPDNNIAIVDEAGLKYSARRSMKDENVLLSGLIATARHHSLTIFFITQTLSLVDIDIFRMRDIVFYLKSSDYTIGERGGKLNKMDKRYGLIRNMMQPEEQGECLFEMPSVRRFIKFEFILPEWWSPEISTLFKGYDAKEKLVRERKEKINARLDYIKQKEEIKADAYAKRGIKQIERQKEEEGIF